MSNNGSSSEQPSPAPRASGMTNRTAIVIVASCVAIAGLVFALTTAGGGSPKVDTSVPASSASLGTGHPTVYEFSTDS